MNCEVFAAGEKGYGQAGASLRKRALKAFNAMSGSPREDIDYNNYTLRQRGRMLTMSAPIATSAIKTNRTNTIGLGLKLNPRPDKEILGLSSDVAQEWEKKVKAEFNLWAESKRSCDITGKNDLYGLQQLCFYSWLSSGDVFILVKHKEIPNNPYSLKLQVIEADRCSTPCEGFEASLGITDGKNKENGNRIYDGVEVDADGSVVAYWFRNTYPYQLTFEKTDWKRVEAYGKETGLPNVIHIMNSERPEQYRGVTYLAPVIEQLLQLRRYTESELTAAVVQSFFTAFVETDANTLDGNPFNEVGDGQPGNEDNESYDPSEYEMGPGNTVVMNPGEKVVFADPTRPASGFENFFKAVCKQIGAALEIPAELLLKEFTASYSASRGALLEAWKSFKMYREWFARDFCKPVYEIWLSEAIARGRINAPGFFNDPLLHYAWLGSEWIGPSQGQLDPEKEVRAEILAVQHGFTTHEAATARLNGSNWYTNMDQLEMEYQKMQILKDKGMLELNTESDFVTNAGGNNDDDKEDDSDLEE